MSFAWPWMLSLALIPICGLVLQILSMRGMAGAGMLPAALRAFVAGGKVRIGDAMPRLSWRFWTGLLLLVLALGRPQLGAKPDESSAREEIVIALDLSRSMLATDALPSRIERARTIATRFVEQSPTAGIGLIGFAGRAYMLAAPSTDRALLLTFLPAVQPDQMVVPGSNLASALNLALNGFSPKATSRTLLLLSDGEAEQTPWRQYLPQLQARGIHAVAVGLGTAEGSQISINGRALADAGGAPVTSRLQADVLRDISRATGGFYLDAAQSKDLAARIHAIGKATASEQAASTGGAKEDRFGWFLLPALLLLLWSALVEWPALPRLSGASRRSVHVGFAMLCLLLASPLGLAVKASPAIAQERKTTQPDPLLDVKMMVRKILAERQPSAADYMALAQATVRYGEANRLQAHLMQSGVLRDGLAAVAAGEALEPGQSGWAKTRAELLRLLKPPRTADDPEEGDGDPNGEQVNPDEGPDADEAGYNPNGQPQDSRSVGGTQRSKSEQEEWRVPSLVKPAYTLRKLRDADRPGELFRLMQLQEPASPRRDGQTW